MEKNIQKRSWLIIEDSPKRAENLMDNILKHYPNEDITWLYAYNEDVIDTRQLNVDNKDYKYKGLLKRAFKTTQGKTTDINFYWLKTKDEFFQYFEERTEEGNQILLLDVELQLFSHNRSIKPFVEPLRNFRKQPKSLIAFVTIRTNPQVQAKMIDKDAKNLTSKDYAYEYGNDFYGDCKGIVEHSAKKWQDLYKDWAPLPLFSEEKEDSFMKLIGTWTSGDCHKNNFDNLKKEEKLCPQYGILKCWVWLLRTLNYLNCEDFQQDFNKQTCHKNNEEEKIEKKGFSPNLIECIKHFGTNDTHNISPLSMLLIIFINFRKIFDEKLKNGDKKLNEINQQFIQAINYQPNNDDENSKFKKIIKAGSVGPLQKHETRTKTWEAFSGMIKKLIVNHSNEEECNIKLIEINHERISVHLKNIDAKELRKKLNVVYNDHTHILEEIEEYRAAKAVAKSATQATAVEVEENVLNFKLLRGHTTSQTIIKYLIQSANPDFRPMINQPFVGAEYKLQIAPIKNGIMLTF